MKRSQGQGAVLRQGYESSEALEAEVKAHVREVIGAIATPEEVVFVRKLPKTRSGKIMRRLLRRSFHGHYQRGGRRN